MDNRSDATQPNPVDTWADHATQEFVHKDVDASMAIMTRRVWVREKAK